MHVEIAKTLFKHTTYVHLLSFRFADVKCVGLDVVLLKYEETSGVQMYVLSLQK